LLLLAASSSRQTGETQTQQGEGAWLGNADRWVACDHVDLIDHDILRGSSARVEHELDQVVAHGQVGAANAAPAAMASVRPANTFATAFIGSSRLVKELKS
jgi:hypothetical protein